MGVSSDPNRKRKSKFRPWDGNIHNLRPLGNGVSGMVLAIDDRRVVKIDIGSERSVQDAETEREIYRSLQWNGKAHKNVLECCELDNPSGLVLERCDDTIRKRLRSMYRDKSPPDEKVVKKWAYDAAQGLAYIHSCGVVQVDVGCHNMMLSADGIVKLGDFAGSSLLGSQPTVECEVRSKLPGTDEPDKVSDRFALGSAMFEMATGSPPYQDRSWREVHGLYKRKKFPRVESMRDLDQIIRRCWRQEYETTEDVVRDLRRLAVGDEDIETSSTLVDSQESLNLELEVSSPDRQPATKYTYVEHAKNPRRKPRKYGLESEKWDKKRGHAREKMRDDKGVGFLDRLFHLRSYKYHVRV